MADREKMFEFDVSVAGATRVRLMIQTAKTATGVILGGKKISKMILKQTQDRFKDKSSDEYQTSAKDGVTPWAKLKPKTKRIRNKDRSQKLLDKGKLYKAIVIARDSLKNATRVGTGHADIGIRRVQNRRIGRNEKIDVRYTNEYAEIQQYGGGRSRVPARPFMGVTKANAEEIEKYMVSTLNKFFIAFS